MKRLLLLCAMLAGLLPAQERQVDPAPQVRQELRERLMKVRERLQELRQDGERQEGRLPGRRGAGAMRQREELQGGRSGARAGALPERARQRLERAQGRIEQLRGRLQEMRSVRLQGQARGRAGLRGESRRPEGRPERGERGGPGRGPRQHGERGPGGRHRGGHGEEGAPRGHRRPHGRGRGDAVDV
jgi:hypothetical protein